VKVNPFDTFRVEARLGSNGGALLERADRLRVALGRLGACMGVDAHSAQSSRDPRANGGTVLRRQSADLAVSPVTRFAFFGIGNYNASPGSYNANVQINTPITSTRPATCTSASSCSRGRRSAAERHRARLGRRSRQLDAGDDRRERRQHRAVRHQLRAGRVARWKLVYVRRARRSEQRLPDRIELEHARAAVPSSTARSEHGQLLEPVRRRHGSRRRSDRMATCTSACSSAVLVEPPARLDAALQRDADA
jgi:hypothetical protein